MITPFVTNCIDYLVKPLTKERFGKTIAKLDQRNENSSKIDMAKTAPIHRDEKT